MFKRQSNSDLEMPLLQRALLSKKHQPRRSDDAESSSVTVHMKDKLIPLEECPKDKPVLTDCDSVKSAIDVGRMSDEGFSARQTVVGESVVQKELQLTESQKMADSFSDAPPKKPAGIAEARRENTNGGEIGKEVSTEAAEEGGCKDSSVNDAEVRPDSKAELDAVVASAPTADTSSDDPDAPDYKSGKEDAGGVFSKTVPVVTLPSRTHRLTPNITLGRDPRHAYFPLSKGIELDYGEATAPGGGVDV